MTAPASEPPRRLTAREAIGPTALLLISMIGLGAVVWGYLNQPDIRIAIVDVGALDEFAIGRFIERPEDNLYLYGMPDGRIRALDMRIQGTGCIAEWIRDEEAGRAHNPGAEPGVFRDPCDGATWSMIGNAISGSNVPLRTPVVMVQGDIQGRSQRVVVEVINP
ncbi:MAG: hypothetical protein O2798_09630 [Chloroflexi bacterium]|nr:hypothetical protein [Chloroflexota bacterium]MDA1241088.1 hypothetical protein [Chloroflexota bacterium]MQC47901.1 hypothetical protein [Chloroflexota bacterium]